MIVSQPREKLWAWLDNRIGLDWSADFRAIGFVREDCLKAVIGYNGFNGRSCLMHSAIDDPAVVTRTFVQEMFRYPFIQCGMTHVMAVVASDNKRALDIDLRVGFREVHRLDGAAITGADLIILEMKRSDCKWIRRFVDGKEQGTPAAGLSRSSGSAGGSEPGDHNRPDLGEPPKFEYALGEPDLAVPEGR